MGPALSKTKVNQMLNNNVVNRDVINIANKHINEQIVNSTTKSAQECMSASTAGQDVKFKKFISGRDVRVDNLQDTTMEVDFSCIKKDAVRGNIANTIKEQMSSQLKSNMSNDLLNKLVSKAVENVKADGFSLPWAGPLSDTKVKQTVNNNILNVAERNIENVVKTVVELNFSQSLYNKCVNKVIAAQGFTFEDVQAGRDIIVKSTQKVMLKIFVNCVHESHIGTSIVEDFAYLTGFEVEDGFKSTLRNEYEVQIEKYLEQVGLMTLFSSIAKFFGTTAGIIGASVSGISASSISYSSLCCILIIIMMILGGTRNGSDGQKSVSMDSTSYHGPV